MPTTRLFFFIPALLLLSFGTIAQDTIRDSYYVRYIYDTTVLTNTNIKQELYCDETIEWAGFVDIDIIPNQKSNQSWDNFQASGFSNLNFKQYTTDSIPTDTSLLDYIITSIQNKSIPIYQTPQLQQPINLTKEDLTAFASDGESSGRYYDAGDFEVLRLRCVVFYDRSGAGIWIYPMAAAPIRTEYDIYSPTAQAFYKPLGWIPVSGNIPISVSWQKTIHSDVPLRNIKVFKQGFTSDEVLSHLINKQESSVNQQQLYDATDLSQPTLLSPEQLTERISYEEITFDPETFEEIIVRTPINDLGLVGYNFSLDWAWDSTKQQLYVDTKGISPIVHNMDLFCDDCPDEKMFLSRLFLLKPSE
jgi:hypothetical protein